MTMPKTHLPHLAPGLAVQTFDQSTAVQVTNATNAKNSQGVACLLEGPEAHVVQALGLAQAQGWSAAQLAAHVGLGADALWAVLDALGDRGLLAQRATPPAQDERPSSRTAGYLMGRRTLALMGLVTAVAPRAMASTVADEQAAKVATKADAVPAQEEESKLSAQPKGEADQKQAAKAQESKRKRSAEQDKKVQQSRLNQSRASEETAKKAAK
jgi:hypothetical protein